MGSISALPTSLEEDPVFVTAFIRPIRKIGAIRSIVVKKVLVGNQKIIILYEAVELALPV